MREGGREKGRDKGGRSRVLLFHTVHTYIHCPCDVTSYSAEKKPEVTEDITPKLTKEGSGTKNKNKRVNMYTIQCRATDS